MLESLTIRCNKHLVALIQFGKTIAVFAARQAIDLGIVLKGTVGNYREGWLYEDGKVKFGCGQGRALLLIDGKLVLNVPINVTAKIGSTITNAGRVARHHELLNHTPSRERLYSDQRLLIRSGLREINLGVPGPEMRSMGGIASTNEIGLPRIIETRKAQRNGHDR